MLNNLCPHIIYYVRRDSQQDPAYLCRFKAVAQCGSLFRYLDGVVDNNSFVKCDIRKLQNKVSL